jgi:hypothetical protein
MRIEVLVNHSLLDTGTIREQYGNKAPVVLPMLLWKTIKKIKDRDMKKGSKGGVFYNSGGGQEERSVDDFGDILAGFRNVTEVVNVILVRLDGNAFQPFIHLGFAPVVGCQGKRPVIVIPA